MGKKDKLLVSKIERGTVIDHLPVGLGYKIIRMFKDLDKVRSVVASNVESTKYGRKDIVKIENRFLTEEEINILAIIAPRATINFIEDYKVIKKFKPKLPNYIIDIIRCPNPKCITNDKKESKYFDKKILHRTFRVIRKENKILLQCTYCDAVFDSEEILDLIIFK